jgi:hypothetical protein
VKERQGYRGSELYELVAVLTEPERLAENVREYCDLSPDHEEE